MILGTKTVTKIEHWNWTLLCTNTHAQGEKEIGKPFELTLWCLQFLRVQQNWHFEWSHSQISLSLFHFLDFCICFHASTKYLAIFERIKCHNRQNQLSVTFLGTIIIWKKILQIQIGQKSVKRKWPLEMFDFIKWFFSLRPKKKLQLKLNHALSIWIN